jgi:ribosomal protein S18 acetylase RimI-like enzyme
VTVDVLFHVGDLMVHPKAQRRGLGRELLDQLVSGRTPAVLVTHPDSGSRRLYEAAGWRSTGSVQLEPDSPLVVYMLD